MVYCDSLLKNGARCRAFGRYTHFLSGPTPYVQGESRHVCGKHLPSNGGTFSDGHDTPHMGGVLHNGSSKPAATAPAAPSPTVKKPACNCIPGFMPCLKHALQVSS